MVWKLITAGVAEGEFVARVVRQFRELTPAELSAGLQVDAAERRIVRKH